MKKTLISFVIPCFRSENTIKSVIDEVIATVQQREHYDYEIVAVNDCSPDDVMGVLRTLAAADSKIKVIELTKNVGKHAAVLAGYSFTVGCYIVDLDDDMQSPIPELWRLLKPLEQGECDYVTAKYTTRKHPTWKRIGSYANLKMSAVMLDKPQNLRFENFSAMHRFVVQEIINYRNPYPYLEGLVLRITSRIQTVTMEQRERGDALSTGFTFRKSISLWVNGLTAFSVKPLRVASLIGLATATSGFVYAAYIILRRLFDAQIMSGYSSLMAVLLITSGIVMLCLGMIGEYVGRIYICINSAPQSVIKATWNISRTLQQQPGEPE
ncbi:glycosyltransferase [Rubripirellula sp.]|nr:glycosyltransferase [Rubripirellula sp.]MDB4644843.1 glycosyltransferase [Rubripirellula sp.]